MHQALYIPELLHNIFGPCSCPTPETKGSHKADLAALARTCKAFKEPALDLLWEELDNFTPLARCLPQACHVSDPARPPHYLSRNARCYAFSRPLTEGEQHTLRGYTSRVRFIRQPKDYHVHLEESAISTIFHLTPFTDPLFPNLRSLYWEYSTAFLPLHVAVPSLTLLHLNLEPRCFPMPLRAAGFFDAFGDYCTNMEELMVNGGLDKPMKISRQICRWPNLRRVHCWGVALNADAISYLASVPFLTQLSFTAEIALIRHIPNSGAMLVFPSLVQLSVASGSLDTAAFVLSLVRLPVLEVLRVTISNYISRRAMEAYWAAAREACPSIASFDLLLTAPVDEGNGDPNPIDEDTHIPLMFEDLHPCTTFSNLHELSVSLGWGVNLTDADLLQLMSPRMESIVINNMLGWGTGRTGGGITLSGLVQLLRQCPLLDYLSVAIDTSTFTEIPEGLDVSFPPRTGLKFDFLDSFVLPEFVPGMVSVFTALRLDPCMFKEWGIVGGQDVGGREAVPIWDSVRAELTRV